MRYALLFVFLFCLNSCDNPSFDIKKSREGTEQSMNQMNKEELDWNNKLRDIASVYKKNKSFALSFIDSLILKTRNNTFHLTELYYQKGCVLYSLDSLDQAINWFSRANGYDTIPKYLIARASAYVKQKKYKQAYSDIVCSSNINYQFLYQLGNYYEVINKKDSSIFYYRKLYLIDSINYFYAKQRIEKLTLKDARLFTTLDNSHDNYGVVLLVNPSTN